jgi:hypothetical protein
VKLPSRRPAETGGVAGAVAFLILAALGVDNPAVLIALGLVVGAVPAAITWAVELARRSPEVPPPPA